LNKFSTLAPAFTVGRFSAGKGGESVNVQRK
jgi:hypothetical protein